MLTCEPPFLNAETSEPALLIRDKLRFISHEKQTSIVALGSTVGLGVVFQRQPSTQTRKAHVGNDSCRQAFENIALTPMSPYHATMPTDKFVQLGMAPLLPSARAGGPAYLREMAKMNIRHCHGGGSSTIASPWQHGLKGE